MFNTQTVARSTPRSRAGSAELQEDATGPPARPEDLLPTVHEDDEPPPLPDPQVQQGHTLHRRLTDAATPALCARSSINAAISGLSSNRRQPALLEVPSSRCSRVKRRVWAQQPVSRRPCSQGAAHQHSRLCHRDAVSPKPTVHT